MENTSLWGIIEQSLKGLLTENGTVVTILMLVVIGLMFSIRYLIKACRQKDDLNNKRIDNLINKIEKLSDKLVTVVENNTRVLTELVSRINQKE